jgi:hypothetical protein
MNDAEVSISSFFKLHFRLYLTVIFVLVRMRPWPALLCRVLPAKLQENEHDVHKWAAL